MTIDEVIKEFTDLAKDERKEQNFWLTQRNEIDETSFPKFADCYSSFARDSETKAERYEQLAEWLTELEGLREENKVLMTECDRLIKEKGELLSKVSGGDVLRICQLEEQLGKAKELLRLAVSDINYTLTNVDECTKCLYCDAETGDCSSAERRYDVCKWKYADEALKLLERGVLSGTD